MATLKKKSGSKVAQTSPSSSTKGKGRDLDYWKARLVKRSRASEGERIHAKDWSVRIQHAGKRQFFNLETPNKTTAAARAKERFEFVKSHGWEAAIDKFKYGEEKAKVEAEKNALTVGEYCEEVGRLATEQRPRTIHDYQTCLRRILSEIYESEGVNPTRNRIDETPLEKITGPRVERWKAARIQKVRGNPQEEKTAKITANTILRQARALFGRKIAPVLRDAGVNLPDSLPLSEVGLFSEDTSAKFKRKIDPARLIIAAGKELDSEQGKAETRAEFDARRQRYLAFVLVFATGLRKSEADMLEWDSVNFEAGELSVETTKYFKPKTEASEAPISLDPETVEILRGFRAQFPKSRFVLRSRRKPKPSVQYAYYRALPTWTALSDWLVSQGVTDSKPIHYCRKAITDYMANEYGIFAAQRHARHTTPQVTARYYSDGKSVAPGIGGLFKSESADGVKVIEGEFTNEQENEQTTQERKRRN